jgi:glycosyltransferase involved in cell wall biosynthesis
VTPLRVAVDATPLLGPRTGVGNFSLGLLRGLAKRPDLETTGYAVTWHGRRTLARELPPGARPGSAPWPARLVRAAWARADAPRIERWTGAVDVVHATNFVPPPAHAPVVVTVHDLTFLHHPELCSPDVVRYALLLRRGLARGAVVHVVSDFVAAEVRDAFGIPLERVVRVYPGIDRLSPGDAARGRALAGTHRYVLAVGTVEPRKNYPLLVDAFDRVAADDSDLALVIAGGDGWDGSSLDAALTRARHRDRVRRLGYVDDAARRDLLGGAALLAYPSRYEGFGIPPLEAMAAGVPVVATAVGALPEVLGEAAVLVAPDDPDELAAALRRTLCDETVRASLIEAGHARADGFSWSTAIDELASLYHRCAGSR